MTAIIEAMDVDHAYQQGVALLKKHGYDSPSRNGPVLVYPGPVIVKYLRPCNRVLIDAQRNCNPFFHLMESLWILNGQRDVHTLVHYNQKMINYSDNGSDFHAAYGFRMRGHFCDASDEAIDQLLLVQRVLTKDPTSRRAVVSMWDPVSDLGGTGKDYPCNTQIYFSLSPGGIRSNDFLFRPVEGERLRLDITVTNRSNDILWGLFGANVVQFSMIQEYMAARLNVEVGTYYQFTNNFHAYRELFDKVEITGEPSVYQTLEPFPLVDRTIVGFDMKQWDDDLARFMTFWAVHRHFDKKNHKPDFVNPFFNKVAVPMSRIWAAWKDSSHHTVLEEIRMMEDCDWKEAAYRWMRRAYEKKFGNDPWKDDEL